ncbi:hypothetical protein BC826DRAFT_1113569 [Russula brevipes]|nr:hypothetical protein BC826DRAFT_1113569 [Russula brevipes]
MALGPVPPPPTNPNPTSNPPKPPPDKPPDPLIAAPSNFFRMNFTEAILPRIPSNPYRGPIPEELRIAHRTSLQLAKEAVTKPFIFHPQKPLELIGQEAGASVSSDDLNAAVDLVIATLEVGYTPSRGPTLVSPEGWASLSCGLLAVANLGASRIFPNGYATRDEFNVLRGVQERMKIEEWTGRGGIAVRSRSCNLFSCYLLYLGW